MYQPGDWVVFFAQKHSSHPGPGAEDVEPEPHGEGYRYRVKKYWVVTALHGQDQLEVATRRGKRRLLMQSNPFLRPAHWWERLFLRWRFPRSSNPQPTDETPKSTARAG